MHTDVILMSTKNCNICSLRDEIWLDISLRHNVMADRKVQLIPLSPFILYLHLGPFQEPRCGKSVLKAVLRAIASLGKSPYILRVITFKMLVRSHKIFTIGKCTALIQILLF